MKEFLELEKVNKYVFHGSESLIDEFEPRQAFTVVGGRKVPDGKPAVFASPFVAYAAFMALINSTNCPKGLRSICSYNDGNLVFKASKATLEQLNGRSKGFVYIFDRINFERRNGSEWISYNKVRPIRFIEVGVQDLPSPILEISEDYSF